jgi:hypothetical protein
MFAGLGVSTMFRILAASRFLPLLLVIVAFTSNASAEWKEKVLYSFQGAGDGYYPAGGVAFDKAGNLYGANAYGGSGGCVSPGCGTVFEISPPAQDGRPWTETTLYSFRGVTGGVNDGFTPQSGIVIDADGNVYGVTGYGGDGPCVLFGSTTGCGTVYELSPPTREGGSWMETILYNFRGGNDGDFPSGNLVFDKQGNIYGATKFGGGKGTACNAYFGGNCGTVFELSPPKEIGNAWTERVLYSFAGGQVGGKEGDGGDPNGDLLLDTNTGAIYGTTYFGGNETGECEAGSGGTGCGIVFELAPPAKQVVGTPSPKEQSGGWEENILFRFNGTDGGQSSAGVINDASGNFYGTTAFGGYEGDGVVFELSNPLGNVHTWTEKALYRFKGLGTGDEPQAGLLISTSGDLYGVSLGGPTGGGVVFRLKPPGDGQAWTASALYSFGRAPDANYPTASVTLDTQGNVYSTTKYGGAGDCYPDACGAVFELSPE